VWLLLSYQNYRLLNLYYIYDISHTVEHSCSHMLCLPNSSYSFQDKSFPFYMISVHLSAGCKQTIPTCSSTNFYFIIYRDLEKVKICMEGTVPTCSEPRRQMFEMAAEWIHNMTHPVCSTKFHLSPPSCHKARQCIEKFGVSSMRSEKSIGEFCRYVGYFCRCVGYFGVYKDFRIF